MDSEKYFAQVVVFNLSTLKIGMDLSCEQAEELYDKYMTIFYSLREDKGGFSIEQLSTFQELELEIVPMMKSGMKYMESYQHCLEMNFEDNHNYLSLPKSNRRDTGLWKCIFETRKTMCSLNELLGLIKDIFKEFLKLVRRLDAI